MIVVVVCEAVDELVVGVIVVVVEGAIVVLVVLHGLIVGWSVDVVVDGV